MAGQAIGIDIGTHAVKIAVLQKKGGATRAVRLFRTVLAGDTTAVRIQGALQRAGITGGPGLCGITGRDLIIRYTHVPPVPDWRLKLLMQFEINEVSGQSGGEVAADYRRLNLPVEMDDDTVLVALARNTWLSPRLDAARAAGMKVGGGCPNSIALFNAFSAHGGWKEEETVFLVNLGRDHIDMAIQRDGELLFARNMVGGGQMFTEAIMGAFGLKEGKAEKNKVTKGDLTPKGLARYPDSTTEKLANAMQGAAGQLVSMIQSSVMICRAQTKITDLSVDRLVLAGGTARMRGIREYFEANMNVSVEIFDPVGELDLGGLEAADREELGELPADFAVAVGLAETLLAPQAFRLEVLTDSEKRKRRFLQRTLWALAAAAAALVLVVLLFRTRSADIAAYQRANEGLNAVQKRFGEILKRQKVAIAEERDARKKAVALNARRIAGAFTRAVLQVLLAHRTSDFIYLERLEMVANKVSLDLTGRPGKNRTALGSDAEAKENLHDQHVWPEVTVVGRMKSDTPNPARKLTSYYAVLAAAIKDLDVGGVGIDMQRTMHDTENRFKITFRPRVPAKRKDEAKGGR